MNRRPFLLFGVKMLFLIFESVSTEAKEDNDYKYPYKASSKEAVSSN